MLIKQDLYLFQKENNGKLLEIFIFLFIIHIHSVSKESINNSEFFCAPLPGGERPKVHMVGYVDGSSKHAQFISLKNLQPFLRSFLHNRLCEFLAPLPQGSHKKFGIKCVFLLTKTV